MPKHKHPRGKGHAPTAPAPPSDARQQGLRAFQAGRFDQAIIIWSRLGGDARLTTALAEAYFRRALLRPTPQERVADLREAVTRAPEEARYRYHLGLALHRAGDLAAATKEYRAVLGMPVALPGAATALALAALEQNPQTDLATLPGSTPAGRATLEPVQALLVGAGPPPAEDGLLARLRRGLGQAGEEPLARLWRGLGQLQQDDVPAARETLDDHRPLPTATATAVRRYYQGVAAARADDPAAARQAWQQVYGAGLEEPWVWDNLAAVVLQDLTTQREAGNLAAATAVAEQAYALAGAGTALAEALVVTLDEAAQAAAGQGDWERAATLWEQARGIVGAMTGLGSPRPLLHNLALAYEAQEEWFEAADAWRAMLRTRPRKTAARATGKKAKGATTDAPPTPNPADPSEAQWAWVRKRVIECYKRAGAPGEAVTVFRQAIKADPSDIDLRLELAEALLANEQEQAARNELYRIRELDPTHVGAQLRLASLHLERGEWFYAGPILRGLYEQHPDRADVRRALGAMLLDVGQHYHSMRMYDEAIRHLEEGRALAPDDYHFPLVLARIAIDQRKVKQAHELLDRVLALGEDQPMAYIEAIECWVVANKPDEARAVLARAETGLPLAPEFYLALATLILKHSAPPPMLNLFGPVTPPSPAKGAWPAWAEELVARAAALRPDDVDLRQAIAAEMATVRPALGLRYAEEAARLAPDNPDVLMTLALLQALNDRKRDAKESLRQAGRLARQGGDPELVRRVEELRRMINNPMLSLALQMGPMLDDLDLDEGPF